MLQFKLDPDKLCEYKWGEDFPITSCIKLYEACGLYQNLKDFYDNTETTVAPVDVLSCNFYTLQWIQRFIEDNWTHYNISIDADEHIFWKSRNKAWHKYENKLSNVTKRSIKEDYIQYCPALDDELEDLIIIFKDINEKTDQ